MNEHDEYEAWRAELFEALRDNVPEFAGRVTDDTGGFENVAFRAVAAHGDAGKHGEVIVTVTRLDQAEVSKGKQIQVPANWRNDDAPAVARNAILAYLKLRGQYR